MRRFFGKDTAMNEKISGQATEPASARTKESTSARMKTFVEWSDALSIGGLRLIDGQHKGLVAMLNEMYEGINGGGVKAAMRFWINWFPIRSFILKRKRASWRHRITGGKRAQAAPREAHSDGRGIYRKV